MKRFFEIQILIITLAMVSGCANFGKKWKAFVSDEEPKTSTAAAKPRDEVVRFSENRDVPVSTDRQYRRMTKKQFEDQELYSDNAGSLWVNEGQDSYLFSQNIVRLPGDILNVVLDGQPEKQLSTKAQVIKELTQRIERKQRGVASVPATGPDGKPMDPNAQAQANGPKPAMADGQKPADPNAQKTADASQKDEDADLGASFDVKTIPTRVVERMSDGNYRVKGSQTFMIGTKEYRAIVTGLVKPQDISDDKVDSSKMLDSKFDIVRYNKGKSL